jgi:hypothetical protein
MSGLKKTEVTGEWKKLQNTTKAIKSRRLRKVGIMPLVGKKKKACRVLIEIPSGNDHLEYLGVDGSIILVLQ